MPRPDVVALVVLVALATTATAKPVLDLGERRFVGGRAVTHLAVCGDRVLSTERYGPRINAWTLPDGEHAGVIGPLDQEKYFAACEGDLVVAGWFKAASLWKGGELVTKVALEEVIAGTVTGGRAYVLTTDGTVHELTKAGATAVWKGGDMPGFAAVLRVDLAVSWSDDQLVWATPKGTKTVAWPAPILAVADLGDAIAVADERGDVRVLTRPALTKPVLHIDREKHGDITSVGGDRRWLAAGTYDGQLVQLARRRGAKALPAVELVGPRMSRAIRAIAVAGERWLAGAEDHRIHTVPLGAKTVARGAIDGHDDLVWDVALDDRWIVTGSSDDTVRIRSLDGKQRKTLQGEGELGVRPLLRVGLTADLVWARDDYDVLYRWKRATLKPLAPIPAIGDAVALDAGRLVVAERGKLGILDLATGKVSLVPGAPDDIRSAKLAAAGDLAAIRYEASSKPVIVVSLATGKTVATMPLIDEATAIALSPDGSRLAVAFGRELHEWTRKTGKTIRIGAHPEPISALAYARDGRLASGDWHGTVRLWKPGTAAHVQELALHLGRIDALTWWKQRLASTGSDYRVKVTELAP